mmetsp:Transcript_24647/g.85748  ORF Transcript_24647/g.85748 Transcript_24647/m.85748 type:complete len:211 (-) Transcript_24647:186-818(-)
MSSSASATHGGYCVASAASHPSAVTDGSTAACAASPALRRQLVRAARMTAIRSAMSAGAPVTSAKKRAAIMRSSLCVWPSNALPSTDAPNGTMPTNSSSSTLRRPSTTDGVAVSPLKKMWWLPDHSAHDTTNMRMNENTCGAECLKAAAGSSLAGIAAAKSVTASVAASEKTPSAKASMRLVSGMWSRSIARTRAERRKPNKRTASGTAT